MQLKTGMRLRSAVGTTQVVVVRAGSEPVDLRCGGHEMLPAGSPDPAAAIVAGFEGESLVGKRYAQADIGLELLCTTAGSGALSLGEEILEAAGAKQLPASD